MIRIQALTLPSHVTLVSLKLSLGICEVGIIVLFSRVVLNCIYEAF